MDKTNQEIDEKKQKSKEYFRKYFENHRQEFSVYCNRYHQKMKDDPEYKEKKMQLANKRRERLKQQKAEDLGVSIESLSKKGRPRKYKLDL